MNISQDTINDYRQYEKDINTFYTEKKLYPYYFYRKPVCHSIIFKILAYNFLHYEQINKKKKQQQQEEKEKEQEKEQQQQEEKEQQQEESNYKINYDDNKNLVSSYKKGMTNRSLSVENRHEKENSKNKKGPLQNFRFNSSNVYGNIKNALIKNYNLQNNDVVKNDNDLTTCEKKQHLPFSTTCVDIYHNNNKKNEEHNRNINIDIDCNHTFSYTQNNIINSFKNDWKNNINKKKKF